MVPGDLDGDGRDDLLLGANDVWSGDDSGRAYVFLATDLEPGAYAAGDASVQMTMQEMSCAVQYDAPIKIFILNNQYMGMVRQWQDMNYSSRYSQSLYEDSLPDFVALAEAYGHVGMKVTRYEDLEEKMRECFALKDRTVFMDICVDKSEHVYPMQIPGGAMGDLFLNKSEKT